MTTLNRTVAPAAAAAAIILLAGLARADVVAPAGYIYDAQLLSSTTQNCIASGPGGTFVAIGPGFTANAQSVVLAKESGELRLVASGFNSIGDCAYDAANDVLYVSDNADNADLGITTGGFGNTGAQTGDTVYAVPGASSASGLLAPDLELLPAGSLAFAAALAVDAAGDVLVGDSAGGGSGTVTKIDGGGLTTPFASGFDFTGGIAIEPAGGDVFVADNLVSFANRITRFDAAGTTVAPDPFAGPSFAFGSVDLAFNTDGRLLATGLFGGDVVSFGLDGSSKPFVEGLTFATSVTVNAFTGRVEMVSSTFTGAAEDKSIHRFIPIDRLVPGNGSAKTECVHEIYGLRLSGGSSKDVVCTDGAACDADGKVDDRCTFPVGFCFDVDDARFPDCDAGNAVTDVSVRAKPSSVALDDAVRALTSALPLAGPKCFFSNGYVVPVKVKSSGEKKDGKAQIAVKSRTDGGAKDNDGVKLVCKPAA